MRNFFAKTIINHCNRDGCFFLTGDLGFMALEEVRSVFGDRFINAGVAEQNMIGVAAGLAREGHKVFVYSIAPFCYARPFEQIRNDICMLQLPVCLVGNGGGYAYGVMGPTHHALEDCATMNALGVRILVPAFDQDLIPMITGFSSPTYLRLGYEIRPPDAEIPDYAPWRCLLEGSCGAVVALGPLSGLAWSALADLQEERRPSVWAVTEFDQGAMPAVFWQQIQGNNLYVIEEHVASGGLGAHIALAMANKGITVSSFVHRFACGYPSGTYGSQNFHRSECGLDAKGIRDMVLGNDNEPR